MATIRSSPSFPVFTFVFVNLIHQSVAYSPTVQVAGFSPSPNICKQITSRPWMQMELVEGKEYTVTHKCEVIDPNGMTNFLRRGFNLTAGIWENKPLSIRVPSPNTLSIVGFTLHLDEKVESHDSHSPRPFFLNYSLNVQYSANGFQKGDIFTVFLTMEDHSSWFSDRGGVGVVFVIVFFLIATALIVVAVLVVAVPFWCLYRFWKPNQNQQTQNVVDEGTVESWTSAEMKVVGGSEKQVLLKSTIEV
eukprot:TRINITY_DN9276_c0_g1_i1.p1 TRINITY_DN9276_c0_g1~~TRINITY_DN9276_c0_g1_i1.p1  ORF type:complete len:260 (+),score=49.84 TRINITY_DN9276_c0_g1_i1:37-780(+)